MRKVVGIAVVLLALGGAAYYSGLFSKGEPVAAQGQGGPGGPAGRPGQGGGPGGGGGGMGGFGGGGFRPPMTVELAKVTRGDIAARLTVVGNLIGQTTVDVVPRTGGRVVSVNVQLGDSVKRGQVLAKIEDQELREQVRQAEASHAVAQATIRQRETDVQLSQTNLERSRNLYGRQLLPKQTLDDAEARYAAAVAQLDLAKAQFSQAQARLEELRISLGNTSIESPVNGFVGRRNVDPGAWASNSAPVVSVVDISNVRLVANVVEKDLRLVGVGDPAEVEVDAYPGEIFKGRIARVAPVLDPATRTASIEIEVPNPGYRLKPGMYARMAVTIDDQKGTLLVPKNAVVDYENKRGVFTMTGENKSQFVPVQIGIEDETRVEIKAGLNEGDPIVTGGASSLRNDDTLLIAGQSGAGGPGGGRRGPGGPGSPDRGQGAAGGRPGGGPPAAGGPGGGRRPTPPASN
jgi:RND family efflux transporter MFP subunit